MKRAIIAGAVLCLTGISSASQGQELTELEIPTLPTPSLGYFTAPIIKEEGFDRDYGLDIDFVQKPAGTYRTDFAAGTDEVGASGTILADVALLNEKGVDTVYLFNVFDFWGAVVAGADSGINQLTDLKGKTLAASLPTTNYAMFRALAKNAGLDLENVEVQGTAVPGLVPMAKSGRVDAVQMWEPAYSIIRHDNDEFSAIDLASQWSKKTGEQAIPYLGVAAHRSWVEENPDLVAKLYKIYSDAASFISQHSSEAAEIISKNTDIDIDVLKQLIRSDRLKLNVYWAGSQTEAAKSVFQAGVDIGYLKRMPKGDVLYTPE